MSTPYDVSTVVSRSYIPEQMQDNMQKGQEQKNTMFLAEFQREFEKKQQGIKKTVKTENAGVADNAVKLEEERKKKQKRKHKENKKKSSQLNDEENKHMVDIQA